MGFLMRYLRDERGSFTPMAAILTLIILGFMAFMLGTSLMYQRRMVVRDAIDAAATSALAAGASEVFKDTNYYEVRVCIQWHYDHWTDAEGNSHSRKVCDLYEWQPRQGDKENYILFDESTAESVARQYLKANLDANNMTYKIKDFEFDYKYDEDRFLTVESDRPETGKAPPNWWRNEFGDGGSLGAVGTKDVRFPRWVEVSVKTAIEIPIPMGKILGRDTVTIYYQTVAEKELKRVSE